MYLLLKMVIFQPAMLVSFGGYLPLKCDFSHRMSSVFVDVWIRKPVPLEFVRYLGVTPGYGEGMGCFSLFSMLMFNDMDGYRMV